MLSLITTFSIPYNFCQTIEGEFFSHRCLPSLLMHSASDTQRSLLECNQLLKPLFPVPLSTFKERWSLKGNRNARMWLDSRLVSSKAENRLLNSSVPLVPNKNPIKTHPNIQDPLVREHSLCSYVCASNIPAQRGTGALPACSLSLTTGPPVPLCLENPSFGVFC